MAAWQRSAEVCPHHGGPRSECGDPETTWYGFRSVCYADMMRAGAQKRYELLHAKAPWHDGSFQSWVKEPSKTHPYHFSAGVRILVGLEDVAPHDNFLSDANASPHLQPEDGDDGHQA